MSSFVLEPPKPWVRPEEYRKYVKDTILAEMNRPSGTNVLEHKDFVILYSGPSGAVYEAIITPVTGNNQRSLKMAVELGASRINDTTAAISLNGINLEPYFKSVLAPLYPKPRQLADALNAAYAEVWGGISELFAELEFSEAATAVCGAGQDRVFVKDELPILVKNKHLKTINKIDMQAVRDMYNEVSPDEAFKLVCLSELKISVDKAQAGSPPPSTEWNDFFDRNLFYEVERDITGPKVRPLTDAQKARKQEIVSKYALSDLYAAAPASWATPNVPSARTVATTRPALGLP